jgi:UDP-N-acetylmuramoylalanine--D-glutamate ligase
MTELKDLKVLVFGMKRSGKAAASVLLGLGARVAITDKRPAEELEDELKDFMLSSIRLYLGGHPEECLKDRDLIILSPGVPWDIPILQKARSMGIAVISELELGYGLIKAANPNADFYAITGTNGKSTTTTLLDLMLNKSRIKSVMAGNIGNAVSGEVDRARSARAVAVEVSSFQLECIKYFKPKVAAILNLAPDHLDRYHALREYIDAKARIFENQTSEDFIVLNADDLATMSLYRQKLEKNEHAPIACFFGKGRKLKGIYESDGRIFVNLPGMDMELIRADEILIKGVHNLENSMAASLMALLGGAKPEAIVNVLKEFPGLEHRMEVVIEMDGVFWINDSKGTNPAATLRSIESFPGSQIVLILGGRDKKGDFESLRQAVTKKARALVLLGEASEKIEKALQGTTEIHKAASLKGAVSTARSLAKRGDVVLFSPACASFDMFRDFEDRGRKFKEEVKLL